MNIHTELSGRSAGARRCLVLITTLAGATPLLGACGSSRPADPPADPSGHTSSKRHTELRHTELNLSAIETEIQRILAKRHLISNVTCPAAVHLNKGESFPCTTVAIPAKYKKLLKEKKFAKYRSKIHVTQTDFTVTIRRHHGIVAYKEERLTKT